MLRPVQAIGHSLRAFIAQRQCSLLAMGCADRDVVLVAKIVQAIAREDRPEIVQCFVGPFTDPTTFVDEIVRQLRLQLAAVQARLVADEVEPWPPMPDEAGDSRREAVGRLRALMSWTAEVVPESIALVWALLPGRIDDLDAWEAFVTPLLPLDGITPWLARHHVIVRDSLDTPRIIPRLGAHGAREARVMEVDLSPERILDDLARRAGDQACSQEERIGAITQLAAADLAYGRLDEAQVKYELLHGHHHERAEVDAEIRALQGLGDVELRRARPEPALVRYRQGLELALRPGEDGAGQVPERLPCILHLLVGASEAAEASGDLEAAEIYCNSAQEVAGKLVNYGAACDALTRLGALRWRRGSQAEAREAWVQAHALAERFGDRDRLDRLREQQDTVGARREGTAEARP